MPWHNLNSLCKHELQFIISMQGWQESTLIGALLWQRKMIVLRSLTQFLSNFAYVTFKKNKKKIRKKMKPPWGKNVRSFSWRKKLLRRLSWTEVVSVVYNFIPCFGTNRVGYAISRARNIWHHSQNRYEINELRLKDLTHLINKSS